MQAFLQRLRPGDGVIDIGANVGAIAAPAAQAVGPSGSVCAVEPDARAAERCAQACRAWPWVTVRRLAVTDHQGTVPFYMGAASVLSSVAEANVARVRETVTMDCDTLDHLAEQVPRLAAIKMDAQGAEGQILAGAEQVLARPGLCWMVELWPQGLAACGSSLRAVCDRFQSHGYVVWAMGKMLDGPGATWAQVLAQTSAWSGHAHTNILVGR